MSRNYQIIIFLLIAVIVGCQGQTEVELENTTRINPYDSQEEIEEDIVDSLTPLKTEIPQIELIDERKVNPEIDSVLKIVERAVAELDIELLLTAMDTNVISSYGGGMYGYEDFKHVWEDDYQKLWNKLERIIELGGFFVNDSAFCLPYTGNVDEEASKIDNMIVPYGCGISTSSVTKLYASEECRKDEAVEIGRTYCIVEPQEMYYGALDGTWKVNVVGTDMHGYIKSEEFYCSADYSLSIERNEKGEWKITAFAPWD